MFRPPSVRKHKQSGQAKINLIPILDAVFIFIFFLLMSANFFKVFEIQSNVPIVSDAKPPKDKKPLALTVQVFERELKVLVGVPSRVLKSIPVLPDKKYDYNTLHDVIYDLKKKHMKDRDAIIEPKININYEQIVKIMDAVRVPRSTDDPLFESKNGINEQVNVLFDQIVFSNIF